MPAFNISVEIMDWQRTQPRVLEESLTDWLIYKFGKACPSITSRQFSRHEEGKQTGADWQWQAWFLTNTQFLGLRIQAKKLSQNTAKNLEALRYKKNLGTQMTTLINDARKNKMYPLYAFYYCNHPTSAPTDCCMSPAHVLGPRNGVFLSPAVTLRNSFLSQNNPPTPANILSVSKPLSCLFCCDAQQTSDQDQTQAVIDRITRLANSNTDDELRFATPRMTDALRAFVDEFLDMDRPPSIKLGQDIRDLEYEKRLEAFKRKYRHRLARTKAMTVFDFRTDHTPVVLEEGMRD